MKKILLYILVVIILFLFSIRGIGKYADYVIEIDRDRYARILKKDFVDGIDLNEVKALFPKYSSSFVSLECGDGTYDENSCPGNFRTSMVVPIEGDFIMGDGAVLVYLYFDKEEKLNSHELYVDYYRFH